MSRSDGLSSRRFETFPAIALVAALAVFLLSAVPASAQGQQLIEKEKPAPYILIHKDGYRIDAMEKPVREGGKVKIRLYPQGLLTVLPESDIDWAATDAINARKAAPAAPEPEPAKPKDDIVAAGPNSGGPVIEKTIIGTKIASPASSQKKAEGAGGGEAAKTAGAGAAPAKPVASADARAEIEKEISNVTGARDAAVESRNKLQEQLATIQEKMANAPPPSGIQNYESPNQRALDRVQAALTAVNQEISRLEGRLSDLQEQEVQAVANADEKKPAE